MGTINYLGMRKMYEKSGNKTNLERMIIHYLHDVVKNKPIEDDEVLRGIDLGDNFDATNLSIDEIISLILNDAKQKSVLIDMVLADDADYGAFVLYEKKQIGNERLQTKVLDNFFKTSVLELVTNPGKYEGFDFIKLEEEFFSRARFSVWDKVEADITFGFLEINPYSEIHDLMIERLFACGEADYDFQIYVKDSMINFLRSHLKLRLPAYILGLLESRPDYFSLMLNPFVHPHCFFEDSDAYDQVKEGIFKGICSGKVNRIVRTLHAFNLKNRLDEVLNAWVENDRSLELDVYGIALLEGRLEDSLDDVYIKVKNKTDEVGPEQPMTMKPAIEPKAQ